MAGTIKEIAKIAGVSRGTVDRALHGRGGVNREIADRVWKIARSMEYLPNKAARALSFHKGPRRIAFVVPNTSPSFFKQILTGVSKAHNEILQFGATVHPVHVDAGDSSSLLTLLDELMDRDLDGLVVTGPDLPEIRRKLEYLADRGLPIITYNSDISFRKRLCYVGQDLYRSGRVAADLMSKVVPGPATILAISGSSDFKAHIERLKGFVESLTELSSGYNIQVLESDTDYGIAETSLSNFLKQTPNLRKVKGVFISTGSVAACIDVLRTNNLLGKVRIITNDELPEVVQGLSEGYIDFTICQDPVNQGYIPVKLMFEYLLNKSEPQDIWVQSPVDIKTIYNIR